VTLTFDFLRGNIDISEGSFERNWAVTLLQNAGPGVTALHVGYSIMHPDFNHDPNPNTNPKSVFPDGSLNAVATSGPLFYNTAHNSISRGSHRLKQNPRYLSVGYGPRK